jgi:hypothetical protein
MYILHITLETNPSKHSGHYVPLAWTLKFQSLHLEYNEISFLFLNWTCIHVTDLPSKHWIVTVCSLSFKTEGKWKFHTHFITSNSTENDQVWTDMDST